MKFKPRFYKQQIQIQYQYLCHMQKIKSHKCQYPYTQCQKTSIINRNKKLLSFTFVDLRKKLFEANSNIATEHMVKQFFFFSRM